MSSRVYCTRGNSPFLELCDSGITRVLMTGHESPFNDALINTYRQCLSLYDCDDPGYNVVVVKNRCWRFISAECGEHAEECKARWKGLRDRYIKERKKLQRCPFTYQVRWTLYSKLDFLGPYVDKQYSRFPKSFIRDGRDDDDDGSLESYSMAPPSCPKPPSCPRVILIHSRRVNEKKHEEEEKTSQHELSDNVADNMVEDMKEVKDDAGEDEQKISSNLKLLHACNKGIAERQQTLVKMKSDRLSSGSMSRRVVPYARAPAGTVQRPPALGAVVSAVQSLPKLEAAASRAEPPEEGCSTAKAFNEPPENEDSIRAAEHESVVKWLKTATKALTKLGETITASRQAENTSTAADADDEETAFGRYVATVLKQMKPERKSEVKLKLFKVLHPLP